MRGFVAGPRKCRDVFQVLDAGVLPSDIAGKGRPSFVARME